MEELEALRRRCLNCRECPLSEQRRHVVFGVGRADAELMFIGEGPGEQEDLTGEPFVGPAGRLLDDMLELIDLHRSQVYIANVVKCRPPRNRDPLGEEQNACRHWLDGQLALVRPKIVVCLGRIAGPAPGCEQASRDLHGSQGAAENGPGTLPTSLFVTEGSLCRNGKVLN